MDRTVSSNFERRYSEPQTSLILWIIFFSWGSMFRSLSDLVSVGVRPEALRASGSLLGIVLNANDVREENACGRKAEHAKCRIWTRTSMKRGGLQVRASLYILAGPAIPEGMSAFMSECWSTTKLRLGIRSIVGKFPFPESVGAGRQRHNVAHYHLWSD